MRVARSEPVADEPRIDSWTAFGLGVAMGVLGGLVLLSFGAILVAVVVVLFAFGFSARPPFGGAGILAGWGSTWLIVLASADARCDPPSCASSDLTPFALIGLGLVGAAVLLLVFGIVRPRPAVRAIERLRAVTRRSPVRVVVAILVGAMAGLAMATFWTGGWAIAACVLLMFASSRRVPGRRVEILWLLGGAVAAILLMLAR